jgi:cysteinyl-tRNA synthetase
MTGKPFAHFWFHARFLLVEGEKMSKSLGNFYTLRDLVLKGHKPSSIRFLLASVPYRNQLNFTWDGLQQAAASVERLRNFRSRLAISQFPEGTSEAMSRLAQETTSNLRAGLDDDLNTAQAQGAIFDMVRAANAAIDAGEIKNNDVPGLLAALEQFDEIFSVLKDDDGEKMKAVFDWASADGNEKEKEISPELRQAVESAALSDSDIEAKISEMTGARQSRNFQLSDSIRAGLTAAGILVEITKEGIRWRRK